MIINPNSSVQVRPDLAMVATAYEPSNTVYIANRILPRLPVDLKIDYFNKIPAESLAALPDARRESGGGFNRITKKLTQGSYGVKEWGLEEAIDLQDEAVYGSIIAGEQQSVELVQEFMLRNWEKRVKDTVINETTFVPSGTTGKTLTTPWDDASATPAADLVGPAENIRSKTGFSKDQLTLVLSPYTLAKLPFVLDVRDSLKIMTQAYAGQVTLEMAARYFGVKEVVVGNATYNTANDGQTEVFADIWDSDYAFLYLPMADVTNRQTRKPGLGVTFSWNYAGQDYLVETYVEDKTSVRVARVREWTDENIVNSVYGQLIKNTKT